MADDIKLGYRVRSKLPGKHTVVKVTKVAKADGQKFEIEYSCGRHETVDPKDFHTNWELDRF